MAEFRPACRRPFRHLRNDAGERWSRPLLLLLSRVSKLFWESVLCVWCRCRPDSPSTSGRNRINLGGSRWNIVKNGRIPFPEKSMGVDCFLFFLSMPLSVISNRTEGIKTCASIIFLSGIVKTRANEEVSLARRFYLFSFRFFNNGSIGDKTGDGTA